MPYIDPRANTVQSGGISFNKTLSKPVIVLMGDSNGSMYGVALKEIATDMGAKVHVISVSAGDPFPETKLYRDSLLFLKHEKPDITIFVAEWVGKIGNNHGRLTTALSEILLNSKHVILIAQPPNLPDDASREGIRQSGEHPIFEKTAFSNIRKQTNAFLVSLHNDRLHVLSVDTLFVKPNGEIRFTNEQGKQLYQDADHLSGYGSMMVKKLLQVEIAQIMTSLRL